jgi:hypothetical protein
MRGPRAGSAPGLAKLAWLCFRLSSHVVSYFISAGRFRAASPHHREAPTTAPLDAPLVRVTGSAFLGSLEIKVIDPNAPGLLEKIRRRLTG